MTPHPEGPPPPLLDAEGRAAAEKKRQADLADFHATLAKSEEVIAARRKWEAEHPEEAARAKAQQAPVRPTHQGSMWRPSANNVARPQAPEPTSSIMKPGLKESLERHDHLLPPEERPYGTPGADEDEED